MTKDEQVSGIVIEQLNSNELQEKYLNLLNLRIEENRKTLSAILTIMILTVFAFPLIIETKISEISIGPFKLHDNSFAISIIPSIFAVCYYKYASIWIELTEQKIVFKNLTSKIFSIKQTSYLNDRIKPFSFTDFIILNHLQVKSQKMGCLLAIFWIPFLTVLMFFPFLFEYYTVKTLYVRTSLDTLLDWVFFLVPILTGIFTLLIYIQAGTKLDEIRNIENKKTIS
jgi:hypothetical protein